jgi:hypothetical protein
MFDEIMYITGDDIRSIEMYCLYINKHILVSVLGFTLRDILRKLHHGRIHYNTKFMKFVCCNFSFLASYCNIPNFHSSDIQNLYSKQNCY